MSALCCFCSCQEEGTYIFKHACSCHLGPKDADADGRGAAQRGDAEMAQKLWRCVRACVELGNKNPIRQIHDQGAGGNCNVVRPLTLCNPLITCVELSAL